MFLHVALSPSRRLFKEEGIHRPLYKGFLIEDIDVQKAYLRRQHKCSD